MKSTIFFKNTTPELILAFLFSASIHFASNSCLSIVLNLFIVVGFSLYMFFNWLSHNFTICVISALKYYKENIIICFWTFYATNVSPNLVLRSRPVCSILHCVIPDTSSRNIDPASILCKSTSGRHRPVSYPDGPMTARYRFT